MAASEATLPAWVRLGSDGSTLLLSLHIQPGARNTAPAGRHGDALRIRIAAPANENRANEALIEYLRKSLALPRSAVRIAQGAHSRQKVVSIGAHDATTIARLSAMESETTA